MWNYFQINVSTVLPVNCKDEHEFIFSIVLGLPAEEVFSSPRVLTVQCCTVHANFVSTLRLDYFADVGVTIGPARKAKF